MNIFGNLTRWIGIAAIVVVLISGAYLLNAFQAQRGKTAEQPQPLPTPTTVSAPNQPSQATQQLPSNPTPAPTTVTAPSSATAKPSGLKPADADLPAAGACAGPISEDIVTITLNSDGVPSPRCIKVTPKQRLRVMNKAGVVSQVQLGQFYISLKPEEAQILDVPFESYLAPGVHFVSIRPVSHAELWLTY